MATGEARDRAPRRPLHPATLRIAGSWAAVLAAALLVVACAAGPNLTAPPGSSSAVPSGAAPPPGTVAATGFKFTPERITIPAGTTLRYVNGDRAEHTVTNGMDGAPVASAAFDVLLDIGATVPVTFALPGVYAVTCKFHPTMTQTVTVTPP